MRAFRQTAGRKSDKNDSCYTKEKDGEFVVHVCSSNLYHYYPLVGFDFQGEKSNATRLFQINTRQLSFLLIWLFHRKARKERQEKTTNFAHLAGFAV
jgi:hypothetical protein